MVSWRLFLHLDWAANKSWMAFLAAKAAFFMYLLFLEFFNKAGLNSMVPEAFTSTINCRPLDVPSISTCYLILLDFGGPVAWLPACNWSFLLCKILHCQIKSLNGWHNFIDSEAAMAEMKVGNHKLWKSTVVRIIKATAAFEEASVLPQFSLWVDGEAILKLA